jgi:hypothetical protein
MLAHARRFPRGCRSQAVEVHGSEHDQSVDHKRRDRYQWIGHSFFLSEALPDNEDAFPQLWDIRPLLEKYLFGDDAALSAAASFTRSPPR